MARKGYQLTSVNVPKELFAEYKISGSVLNKFSFSDLVTNALDLFIVDSDYRNKILNHTLTFTGSKIASA